ncbi:MAG: nucleotidyl transferase AbiEii/AbiGii toxin family protein [Bacteroidales bacterium]|nr:nucleotidyl transferase AbiEii/AbiGii toxin family protein [Bacteroidales bacterium]
MIDLQNIRAFYPGFPESPDTDIQLYKEYLELMVLDYLSSHSLIGKLTFIGDTALRLLRQIDRFSEDLDFDCKNLSQEEFASLTDDVVRFLRRNGLPAVAKEKESDALTAFRRTIQFPQLLYDLGLSPYREKKFVLKIEAQDQGVDYQREMFTVNRDGFYFRIPSPSDATLYAMKLSTILHRGKGRDFYDAMFLRSRSEPDMNYLSQREGIATDEELRCRMKQACGRTDFRLKAQDFKYLLFYPENSSRILDFPALWE